MTGERAKERARRRVVMIFAANLRLLLPIQEVYLTTLSAKFSSPAHFPRPAFYKGYEMKRSSLPKVYSEKLPFPILGTGQFAK